MTPVTAFDVDVLDNVHAGDNRVDMPIVYTPFDAFVDAWILTTGIWNDAEFWDDDAIWKDLN